MRVQSRRRLSYGVVELDCLLTERTEVGRGGAVVSVRFEVIGTERVDGDQYDVGGGLVGDTRICATTTGQQANRNRGEPKESFHNR